jgi:hypothetical protein
MGRRLIKAPLVECFHRKVHLQSPRKLILLLNLPSDNYYVQMNLLT